MVSPPARIKSAANVAWQFALLIFIAYAAIGFRTGQVSGISMEPRIDSDEEVVINHLAYQFGAVPHRGDVIAFAHERSAPSVYLKRVIGVPGDRIEIRSGTVFVDGAALAEPYVRFRDDRSFGAVTVPPNAYYVLGDNRANSDDSRFWGFVPRDDIIGRATVTIWPPAHAGLVR